MLEGLARGSRHLGWGVMAVGLLAALAPMATGATLMVLLGLLLLAAAALIGLFGLRLREAGKGNTGLVIAALAAIAGLVLVVQPTAGLSVLRLFLIPYFALSAASELATAWELRAEDDRISLLVAGVVSLFAAVALWAGWPIGGARAVGLLVGIKLASLGWAIVRVSHRLDRLAGGVAAVRARLR